MNKLLVLSFTLDASALGLANASSRHWLIALCALVLHVLASLLVATPIWLSLPRSMRQPRRYVLLMIGALNFFVPTMAIWLRAAIEIAMRTRKIRREAPVSRIDEPEYSIYRDTANERNRAGRIRATLSNPEVPTPDRLAALMALQETPGRVSADILRGLLADPVEDIRLLAYGLIDGKEKAISGRILAEEGRLEAAADDDARFGAHKRVAELYWELVFQHLVQGDMRRHACLQAREHAQSAAGIRADDAGLFLLLGRIGIALDEPRAASAALETAHALGYPADALLPYQAEVAFLERRFEQVGRLFSRMSGAPAGMRAAAAHAYWSR